MTRDMSLTVLLMLTSIAAAVAAPDLGLVPETREAVELQIVATPAWSAGIPGKAARAVRANAAAALPAVSAPCLHDASEPYRLWHHGSLKLVAGCGADTAT